MKNNFYSLLIAIILISFFIMIFVYSKDIYDSVIFSISIWKDNLLPNLFPFFLLSDILIEYGVIDIISLLFGKIISKFFNLPKEASYILITSMISGFPSGSKYIKDLWEKKLIDLKSANHLIMFTHFSNPTFVISTIGILLLNSKKLGFIILICHIISNLIIGILFKQKKYNNPLTIETIKTKKQKRKSFIIILTNSITKSFSTLINMLGIIIFFLIITNLLKKIIPLNNTFGYIISGILEMTQGVKYISQDIKLPINIKCSIIGAIISFSGISVHFQVKSIIEETPISYKNFLIARIIHSILCFILIYLFV